MSIRSRLGTWPVVRQLITADRLARGTAVRSARTEELTPRTRTADRVVKSICPYCAVGCGQRVYVKGERVVQIEGDPDSPISRGRLCPKGSASEQLVNSPGRVTTVKYRRPYGTDWEELPLERAMEMIADRVLDSRARTWEDIDFERRRGAPHARHREPRGCHARQRRELPHQEALHRDRGCAGREPGPHLTQLHRPQSGDLVRTRWRDDLSAGSAER